MGREGLRERLGHPVCPGTPHLPRGLGVRETGRGKCPRGAAPPPPCCLDRRPSILPAWPPQTPWGGPGLRDRPLTPPVSVQKHRPHWTDEETEVQASVAARPRSPGWQVAELASHTAPSAPPPPPPAWDCSEPQRNWRGWGRQTAPWLSPPGMKGLPKHQRARDTPPQPTPCPAAPRLGPRGAGAPAAVRPWLQDKSLQDKFTDRSGG